MLAGVSNSRRKLVRSILIPVLFAFAMLVPSVASAALVQDSQHLLVMMQNGIETTLVAQGIDFSKVKANDTLKISLVKGKVPVFTIQ
jgi:hypothetical protein